MIGLSSLLRTNGPREPQQPAFSTAVGLLKFNDYELNYVKQLHGVSVEQ